MITVDDAESLYADPRLHAEIECLDRLVADLRRIRDGPLPTPAEIETMPMINNWQLAARTLPCLVGTITGHPKIGMTVNRDMSMTSDLWVHAPRYGFARTLSRFYALGSQLGDSEN
ncbi:hypothetical protein LJR231_001772 [Phyllobacterium sp. LjRoot231]|uniref:hypothetical protein n=1 Tax=Phyllobacterium sp. LjRoot231 TaxID=3342289 RepID=UPI003ECD1DB1